MPASFSRIVSRIAHQSSRSNTYLISRKLSSFDDSFNGGRGFRDEERTQRRGSEPRRNSTPNAIPYPNRPIIGEIRGDYRVGDRRVDGRGEVAEDRRFDGDGGFRGRSQPIKRLRDSGDGNRLPSSSLEFLKNPLIKNDDDGLGNERFLDKMKTSDDRKGKNGRGLTEIKPADADEIFKKMKENGLIPNAVAMLDGLCKDGLVHEAMKLFRLIRETGQIPQVVVYTAVVEGFCKASKCGDAKRVFRKMIGNGVVPNAFSYAVLIQGLLRCGEVDDAADFGLEMLGAGHSLNVVTLVGLIDGVAREKGLEVAQMFIQSLREKGYFVDEKAVRIYLDKNAPNMHLVAEAIFGMRNIHKVF